MSTGDGIIGAATAGSGNINKGAYLFKVGIATSGTSHMLQHIFFIVLLHVESFGLWGKYRDKLAILGPD